MKKSKKSAKKKPIKASKKKSPSKAKKKVSKKAIPTKAKKKSAKPKAKPIAKKPVSKKPVSKKKPSPKPKRTRTAQKPLFSTSPETKEIFQVREPFVTTEINVEQDEPFLDGTSNENIHKETDEFLEENEDNNVEGQ